MKAFDVLIGGGVYIHTVRVCCNPDIHCKSSSPNLPLVMIHGIGGAIPAFFKNYESLATDRCVYGIDMPGFGLSERKVQFPNDPSACEQKMVGMIDQWREEMNIDKMILLGYSFGGYVAAAYTLQYHERVQHLVMLDAWGIFSEEDDNHKRCEKLVEKIAKHVCQKLRKNPYAMFASFGDLIGRALLRLFLDSKVQKLYGQTCTDYLIKMSLTGELTGAKAFTVMSNYTFCYPKQPLKGRLIKFLKKENPDLQLTFLFGEDSLFCKCGHDSALEVKKAFSTVNVQCIKGAEHHVQVQKPVEMIEYILNSVYPASMGGACDDDSVTSIQNCTHNFTNQMQTV